MKKFIFSAIAAIGLLLSPSCSDENEALSGSGNEALVSFSVNLADGIQTKADPTPPTTTLGNGTKAKNLVVDVFEKNTSGEYIQIGTLRHAKDNEFQNGSLSTTVNFNLVKGKTYRLIFWAQAQSVVNSTNSPYNISNLSTITVDYTAGITNDEDRDAFLYVTDPITVSGNFTKSITMTRPFAQLNYLIDRAEYDAAVLAGMDIQKAKVTVAKVATQLNPLTNSVSEPEENMMFEVTAIPTNFANLSNEDYLNLPTAGATSGTTNYYYLASKYFLVYAGNGEADKAGDPATLATTSFKLINGSDEEIANYEFKVSAVPVQRNFRTNIYGNLITSQGTFNVTIDPMLNGQDNPDNNLPQYAVIVNNVEEINDAINEKKATTFIASESFSLSTNSGNPTTITVPKTYATENNGVELTFDLSKATVTSGTAEITITEGTGTQSLPENVNVIASGNITINLPTSHVTLNGNEVSGGTYNTVTASTSGTTLVVPNGVTVTTLKVKKGNVRIEKGGTVGTIVRTEDNEDRGNTIVFLEDGGVLTNTPDENSKIIVVQPAIISNAAELKAFAEAVNRGYTYAGETVVLSADIDLNGVKWTPIGGLVSYPSVTFAGTFDGNNHTISNLKTSDFTTNHATAGFFGSITGTVKNLTLTNVNITSSHYAGGIVGYSSANGAVIENCHVNGGTITSKPEYTGTSETTNGYDNGDKVGGIIGYMVAGDKVENCSVSNVTIKAYRDLGGIAGYAAGTVTNNKVSDVTLIQDNTNGYKTDPITTYAEVIGREASATATDNTFSNVTKTVKTFGALDFYKAATGGDVTLTEDATLSGVYKGYGDNKTAVNQNGGTIDGQGHTLTVKGVNNTWDCSIYTKGGTIKNLTIKGGFRGIFTGGLSEDLNVENVVLDYCCYTFNADASNGKSVYFKDCTLNGWTSYTSGFANFSFTNCSFGKGSGGYNYAYLRPYSPTTLENCRFSVDYKMDASQTSGIVLKNCYVGETLITQENLTELLGEDASTATVQNN